VREFQRHEVLCSLQPKRRPYVYIPLEELEDEERTERRGLVYHVDEMLADSVKIFFDKMSKQVKILDDMRASAYPKMLLQEGTEPPIEIDPPTCESPRKRFRQ
jgi:hypothetical protein